MQKITATTVYLPVDKNLGYYELFDGKTIIHLKKKEDQVVMSSIDAENLINAFQEVLRISDRKHDAWDKAKELINNLLNNEQ